VANEPGLTDFGQQVRLVGFGQGLDQLIEVTSQDTVKVIQRQPDAMVGDPALGEIIGADPFGAIAGTNLQLAIGRDFALLP